MAFLPAANLSRAVVASLLLHLIFLLGLHQFDEHESEQRMALRAELRPVSVKPVTRSPPTEVPSIRRSGTHSERAAGAAPVRQMPAEPPSVIQTPLPRSVSGQPSVPDSVGVADARVPAEAAGAGPIPPGDAAAAFDGEDERRYRLEVARQAKRFKRYPLVARERGWAGRTEVALSLAPNSKMPAVALEKTSGYTLLDEQAVEMILQASRVAKVPPGLQQRSVRFVVPVVFDLDD